MGSADQGADRVANESSGWCWRDVFRIYANAGVTPPVDLSIRELYWMAMQSIKERWNHTSFIAAAIINTVAKEQVRPIDLHPFQGDD